MFVLYILFSIYDSLGFRLLTGQIPSASQCEELMRRPLIKFFYIKIHSLYYFQEHDWF